MLQPSRISSSVKNEIKIKFFLCVVYLPEDHQDFFETCSHVICTNRKPKTVVLVVTVYSFLVSWNSVAKIINISLWNFSIPSFSIITHWKTEGGIWACTIELSHSPRCPCLCTCHCYFGCCLYDRMCNATTLINTRMLPWLGVGYLRPVAGSWIFWFDRLPYWMRNKGIVLR